MAEVGIATAKSGLRRADANNVVVKLAKEYREKQAKPDIGRPFPELYDTSKVIPKQEWNEVYIKMKRRISDLSGLDL
jgi:hypothetical protein